MNLSIINQFITADLWQYSILGNTLGNIFFALLGLPIFLVIFKIIQNIIIRRLERLAKKTKTDIDDMFVQIIQSLRPPFYFFLSFYFAIQFLVLSPTLDRAINILLIAWIIYQIIIALQILTNYILKKMLASEDDKGADAAIELIGKLVKYSLWIIGSMLLLSNVGLNISSLIAGLGIGGIAIALALQSILSDLFSSFAIYFDKPFTVGDFITVGMIKGTVIKIGIKTTRLKSLDGEQIVISNKELTSAQIQNFKKMEERRVVITFGVVYKTETAKLRKIPRIIKAIIKNIKDAKVDRVHFKQFSDSSLDFEVVYFVETNKYKKYMDINEKVLLKIKEEFEKEKIEMAYPTQTVYLQK